MRPPRPLTVVGVFGVLAVLGCGDPEFHAGSTGGSGAGEVGGGGSGAGSEGGNGSGAGFVEGGGGSGGTGTGGEGGAPDTTGCGDGLIQVGEVCDDGNSDPGDGCASDCKTVEQDFACPDPGEPCQSTVECGDGAVTGQETCDDGDSAGGDGCSSTCMVEPGWQCTQPGQPCIAAACGDGIVAGNEDCEDDNVTPTSGDGCSDTCKREFGYVCHNVGEPCEETFCGDGVPEGDEPCDDGDDDIGDGCNPFCQVEPTCANGPCTSNCGDGLILPSDQEDCDDGNTTDGDGCSALCEVEEGFDCEQVLGELPDELVVPIAIRDFIALPTSGNSRHPDFNTYGGSQATPGLVANQLGLDGKPVYTGICEVTLPAVTPTCPYNRQTTSQADFDVWYRDDATINRKLVTTITLGEDGLGGYFFESAPFFGPADGFGHPTEGTESLQSNHNFGFTSEVRTWFEFKGDESLLFSGDDDVWVFIAGKLALDLGGLHPQRNGSFVLDTATATALNLVVGNVYEIALFHAERHTDQSNFNLTLNGFVSAKSTCDTDCGDGIVAGDETCDDGVNDGSYNGCTAECTPGPHCGDQLIQMPDEECDDGVNLTNYSFTGEPGCAPGCQLGAYCGDGNINSLFGEECDDGTNDGGYGGCNNDCSLGPHCGDGTKQTPQEECDDGNTVSGDGCDSACDSEIAT